MNTVQPDAGAPDDELLLALLAASGPGVYAKAVQQEVDALLAPGQSLEPDARHKLIAAAKRGARERNLRAGAALETLLFEARRTRQQDADTVAATAGLDVTVLRSIERGELRVQDHPAGTIASWAYALTIHRELLNDALRRSLGSSGGAHAYAGEQPANLGSHEEQFVNEVLQAYDQRAANTQG